MELLERFIEEAGPPQKPWYSLLQYFPSGLAIMAQSSTEKLLIVHAAMQSLDAVLPPVFVEGQSWNDWSCSPKRHAAYALKLLLSTLFQQNLPLSSSDAASLLNAVAHLYHPESLGATYYFSWLPLPAIIRNLEQHYKESLPSPEECHLLQQLISMLENSGKNYKENWELANRISQLPGVVRNGRPEASEAWTNKATLDLEAMTPHEQLAWHTLFNHAITAESAIPSAKWLAEASWHRAAVGEENMVRHIAAWMEAVAPPPPFLAIRPDYPKWSSETEEDYKRSEEEMQKFAADHKWEIDAYRRTHDLYFKAISEKNITLLKGLAWYAAGSGDTNVAFALSHMVAASFTSIRERGIWAARAGSAGIWALGQMPGGIGIKALATLRTQLKDRGALKLIAAAVKPAAKASGMTVDEFEDLAVPTSGMDADGTRTETLGVEGSARLTLDAATGQTKLEWFGPDGKPRKAVPAGVKREFGAEAKALKALEEEVTRALFVQTARLDKALLDERVWTLGVWRERYGSHPVLGNLARRLIWRVGDVAALPVGDKFVDVAGQAIEGLADEAEVKLWNPIHAAPEEVMRWRDMVETRGLVQPFKQAHREFTC